jgi:hypothetical protein
MTLLVKFSAGAVVLATFGLIVAAGCNRRSLPRPAAQATVEPVAVGNAVCGECHTAEFHAHSESRHALTMRALTPKDLGALAPPLGMVTPTGPLFRRAGPGYELARLKDQNAARTLDLALGSGKSGMTYVAIVKNWRVAEVHMSYFPRLKRWFITPGQEDMQQNSFGRTYPSDISAKCILCHAVRTGETSLLPRPEFFGVGCESCHGPGSAHVAAVRAGQTNDLHMERISSWGADRINAMCGHCHRTAGDITRPEDYTATNRFAAYGLMLSQCYQQSHNTLSCVTCHDPHTNASTDPNHYIANCLNCHSGADTKQGAGVATTHDAVQGKRCKVNPTSKCLDCHMPRRPVFHGVPVTMRDHYIRINPPGAL